MSEHYDFHYQPTGSGAISGQQVLQQTEDAINELGDYVNDNIGGAMDVAQQALETAQNAEQDAQTALDTANSFSSAIQSAQQDASTALSTAQTAQTTASNANNTAIQAQQDASNAVTTANNASGQVSTLSGTVTALGQRVTTAEGNIGQNTSDITALTTRVGTAEGNITTLQNDVTIAQGNASSAMATAGQVKQQAFVFRYSSTALIASSTNSNTLLDNTDNLKVGDKVIDSDGVLFSITAIDTVNSTFTVGSALVDLALDANVVHTSGDESITGTKRFGVVQNFTGYPSIRLYSPKDDINVLPSAPEQREIRFTDKNNISIAYFIFQHRTDANEPFRTCWRQNRLDGSDNYYSVNFNNLGEFYPENNNAIKLGTSLKRWSEVYATNYYYGSNNVEFSTKFVTTDTAQSITAVKTITDANLEFKSTSAEYGVSAGDNSVIFKDKNNLQTFKIYSRVFYSGVDNNLVSFFLTQKVDNTYYTSNGIQLFSNTGDKNVILRPILANNNADGLSVSLGARDRRWKDVQTNQINGLTPSSLSLPSDRSARIDISSYFIYSGNNATNNYSVLANGYIFLKLDNINQIACYSIDSSSITNYAQTYTRPSDGVLYITFPVRKNDNFRTIWNTGSSVSIENAYFIPCQGNV